MNYDREFLTGTVGVLILSLLGERPMYGYEIHQHLLESVEVGQVAARDKVGTRLEGDHGSNYHRSNGDCEVRRFTVV